MTDVNNAAETSAQQFTNFDSWDKQGNPVVTEKPAPKTEEAAASAVTAKSDSEPKGKSAAESEAAPKQERKPGDKLSAGEELAKLRRELREAKEDLERERSRKPEPKPAEPAKAQPKSEPQYTRPKPTVEDKVDGKAKYATYEDYVEDLADWKAEQRIVAAEAERGRQQSMEKFSQSVSEARKAYADFDSVAEPMAKTVNELILDPKTDQTLRKTLFDPEAVHILYALGKDPKLAESFGDLARTDPAEAIFLWKSLKASVKQELSKPEVKAEPKEESPAPPKPRAPKPPSEVGGRGSQSEDALISAAKANDFRAFEAEQRRRALASR